MFLRIDGLDEYAKDMRELSNELKGILTDIMRGRWGLEFRDQLRALTLDYRRTGFTASRIDRHTHSDGVEIGIADDDTAKHPVSGVNARALGAFLESGTPPHYIPAKSAKVMNIGGKIITTRFVHPGTPARRIVRKSMRVFRPELMDLIVRELERRKSGNRL